jgi:RNA polymerase sigma-70 factor (ECF subfamily)
VHDELARASAAAPAPFRRLGVEDGALQRALRQLDPLQREAVLLKYAEGLEYGEMVRLTGVGESALKMRVKRGAERLRTLLAAERKGP